MKRKLLEMNVSAFELLSEGTEMKERISFPQCYVHGLYEQIPPPLLHVLTRVKQSQCTSEERRTDTVDGLFTTSCTGRWQGCSGSTPDPQLLRTLQELGHHVGSWCSCEDASWCPQASAKCLSLSLSSTFKSSFLLSCIPGDRR